MAPTGALSCTSSSRGMSSISPTTQFSATSFDRSANSRATFSSRPGLSNFPTSFQLQSSIISRTGSRRDCERTVLLPRKYHSLTRQGGAGRAKELRNLVPRAAVKEEQPEQASVEASSKLKEFIEDLKTVGRVRLIVNTGVAVLESVTSLEKLYYHVSPRGEYANVMSRDENVDFHLNVDKVAAARLVKGKSMRGDIPTYMVRFLDVNDSVAISVLVMWKLGTDGDYDPGQVEAFEALAEKYGEEVKFSA